MSFTIENRTLKKYEGNEENVIVPEDVKVIADYAFSHAKQMKHIVLPNTLEEIGDGAFYDCEQLETIDIPDTVYYLGMGVFSRCLHLKKVKLSNKLRTIPKITFYQCTNLQEINFPKNIQKLGRACFQQCTHLQRLVLPDSIVNIEENAFDDCLYLSEIKFPSSLEEIGDNVFFHCQSLRQLVLPKSVKKIGVGAFETHGKVSVVSNNTLWIRSNMFDHNWNMNWNFGANGRYNGKNEENYQLQNSYLPNVSLKEWKLEARCILCINYLETYRDSIFFYDEWIQKNASFCVEKMVLDTRFEALNQALQLQLISIEQVEPFLNFVQDREERAKLLEYSQPKNNSIDQLWDLL
ncbi:MAG: leucine-rich repeat protein [Bacillota bacterium]|nr:leucine-rich repeat protein [Bacillota bacterium]